MSGWHQVSFGAVVIQHGHRAIVGFFEDVVIVALEFGHADSDVGEEIVRGVSACAMSWYLVKDQDIA
jgi:hypothetical protein